MQPAQFQRHLQSAEFAPAPAYLLGGDGQHLIEEAWSQILERLVPSRGRRLNGERLSAKDVAFAQVRDRLNTLPMFGSKRLLAVQQVEVWNKEQQKELMAYLAKPNPMACLVLIAAQKKGVEKIESAVESCGVVVRFPAMTERDAPRWLQERARHLGKSLAPQAALFIVEQVGAEPELLVREIEKLVAYVGAKDRIELGDARQSVSVMRTHTVFEMLSHVSEGDPQRALATLKRLLLAGEQPLIILALLARHLRIVWQVRDGLDRGLPQPEIAKKLNLFPSAMKGYVQQAKTFPQSKLYRFHRALCETDMALKLSSTSPSLLLEDFILSLCVRQ